MGTERYEELAQAVYEAFNALDDAAIDERFADDYVDHTDLPPGIAPDRDGVKAWLRMMRGGFPDLRFEILDVIAVEGKACCRARMTGTNSGPMAGMPPTGRAIDVESFDYVRIDADDRVAEHWGAFEEGKMMRQLGMIPEQSGAQADAERPTGV
jgi:steroid delta-isomerase-like uncharacterized protein